MPNPKVGTVTPDVAGAVKNAKAGQVRYRTDKAGIIHCGIGKVDFEAGALQENLEALLLDLTKIKPTESDNPLGEHSGAGAIYGASGGVMESALRTAMFLLNKRKYLT